MIKKAALSASFHGKSGRSERIRTSDPLLPKQVRYQAALRSDRGGAGKPGAGELQAQFVSGEADLAGIGQSAVSSGKLDLPRSIGASA